MSVENGISRRTALVKLGVFLQQRCRCFPGRAHRAIPPVACDSRKEVRL